MLTNIKKSISMHPYGGFTTYANWAILETHFILRPYEISIVGKDFDVLKREFG